VGDVPERLRGLTGASCVDEPTGDARRGPGTRARRADRVNVRAAVTALDEHLLTTQVIRVYRAALNGAAPRQDAAVAVGKPRGRARGWDALVRRFPNCRVVHTRGWIRSLEASEGRPLYLCSSGPGGRRVLAGACGDRGTVPHFGSPLPDADHGHGPVFDRPVHARAARRTAPSSRRYATHHSSGKLRSRPCGDGGVRIPRGAVRTYRASLYPGDEGRALKAMKESARRNIKRAVKLGLVRCSRTTSIRGRALRPDREVFTRAATPSHSTHPGLEYFRHMREAAISSRSRVSPDRCTNIRTGCSDWMARSCFCGCGRTARAIAGTGRPS